MTQLCPLAAMRRYYCVECLITHVGDCTETTLADSIQEEIENRRRCKVCEPPQKRSSEAAGKRKRGSQRDDGDDDPNGTSGSSGEKSAKKRRRKAPTTLLPDLCYGAGIVVGSSLEASM